MTSSLLSRLQALTGPDREIDAEIALANGWKQINYELWRHGEVVLVGPPRYTASIDAALTLKPEGWRLHILDEHYGKWSCSLHRAFGVDEDQEIWKARHSWPREYTSDLCIAVTGPIALCIAALKAKEESTP